MKKIYLIFALLLTTTWGFGQITLLDSDMGAIGDRHITGTDTLVAGVSLGSPGANQTWDLSGLVTHYLDTIDYVDPATTPSGADFPDATLCVFQSLSQGYNYLKVSASALEVLGFAGDPFGVGVPITAQVDPSRTLLQFPFDYLDSYNDTSMVDETVAINVVPGFDSARYKSKVYLEVEADGWGDLILGSGTYNSLRVKEISRSIDTIWAYNSFLGWVMFDNTDVTDSSFTWWDKARGFALATASVDSSVNEVTYVDPAPVAIDEADWLTLSFSVYPNPSEGEFHFSSDENLSGELEIFDVRGQRISQQEWRGNHTVVDLKDANAGIYFYRMQDENGKRLYKGKLIVQ